MTLGKEVDVRNRERQDGRQFLEVGKVDEVPAGKMKHVEVLGKEIVILNIDGKFYAMDDGCAHGYLFYVI
jgi:nitrite reductase/ring-hydroxylating ferredoxin subunit